jgi:TonB family protein
MSRETVAEVKEEVFSRCRESSPAKGDVKVRVKVAPDGNITNVQVVSTPDVILGNCVKDVIQKKAKFPSTKEGGDTDWKVNFNW